MNTIKKKGVKKQINPKPIEKTVNITLEQAYKGSNIPITIERIVILNREKKKENETIYVNIDKGVDNDEIINIEEKLKHKNLIPLWKQVNQIFLNKY